MDQEKKIRIEKLLSELESLVPNNNAKVRIDVYGGGIDEWEYRGRSSDLRLIERNI